MWISFVLTVSHLPNTQRTHHGSIRSIFPCIMSGNLNQFRLNFKCKPPEYVTLVFHFVLFVATSFALVPFACMKPYTHYLGRRQQYFHIDWFRSFSSFTLFLACAYSATTKILYWQTNYTLANFDMHVIFALCFFYQARNLNPKLKLTCKPINVTIAISKAEYIETIPKIEKLYEYIESNWREARNANAKWIFDLFFILQHKLALIHSQSQSQSYFFLSRVLGSTIFKFTTILTRELLHSLLILPGTLEFIHHNSYALHALPFRRSLFRAQQQQLQQKHTHKRNFDWIFVRYEMPWNMNWTRLEAAHIDSYNTFIARLILTLCYFVAIFRCAIASAS